MTAGPATAGSDDEKLLPVSAPQITIEAVYGGRELSLAVFARPPDDEPPGMKLNVL